MADRKQRNNGVVVVVLVIVFIITALIASIAPGVRDRHADLTCRTRLFRLGKAMRAWIEDRGGARFPRISNPEPGQPWQPGRSDSTQVILGPYLQGDVGHFRPRRPEESEAVYRDRLRENENTVCPINGQSYWYNVRAHELDPRALARGRPEELQVFACQRNADGSWPHAEDGVAGVHALFMAGVQRQVNAQEIDQLRQRLADRRARDPDDPTLGALEARLQHYATALADAPRGPDGRRVIAVHRLGELDVRFLARE
ncbi:MAG: hypothetical protein ACOCYP_01540 [Planctomycetota bacterium]